MKKHHQELAAASTPLSRRAALGLMVAPIVAGVRRPGGWGPESAPVRMRMPACVVKPQQTEGPYFIDDMLDRADIRTEPSDDSVSEGIPLRLAFNVSRVDGDVCAPVEGAVVDVWQCDAQGVYSGFEDIIGGLFDTRGQKFLRGLQKTDHLGHVEFLTIYPGWYPQRAVHIHFKIRTDPDSDQGHEFTSQVYFDESLTDQVYKRPPYAEREKGRMKNEGDNIFREGGDQLMLNVTRDEEGYTGVFDIGLDLS
jgi:protocatechuate 3,4-dioxygenase beta subunit